MNKSIEAYIIELLVNFGYSEEDAIYEYYEATVSIVKHYIDLKKNYNENALDHFTYSLVSDTPQDKSNLESKKNVLSVLRKSGLDEQTASSLLRKGEKDHLKRLIEHTMEDL